MTKENEISIYSKEFYNVPGIPSFFYFYFGEDFMNNRKKGCKDSTSINFRIPFLSLVILTAVARNDKLCV